MADSKHRDEAMVERGDPAFLRRVANNLRSKHNLQAAMELERIANELERPAVPSLGDDDMVERVAKAIEAETGYSGDIARRQARAVIAAMTG